MMPINDFNFVMAGIATFAATVGYACTRRLSNSFIGPDSEAILNAMREQSKVDVEPHQRPQVPDESVIVVGKHVVQIRTEFEDSAAVPPKRCKENLKRKVPHDGFEEPEKPVKTELGYPHNLAHIYPPPNKRFKTPPGADDKTPTPVEIKPTTPEIQEALKLEEPEIVVKTPPPEPPRSPSPEADTPSPVCINELSSVETHPLSMPPAPFSSDIQPTTPQPTVFALPQTTISAPVPAFPKSLGKTSFSGGFAAFAGSTSPFSTVAGNTSHPTFRPGRSIWGAASDLAPHQNDQASKLATDIDDVFRPGSQPAPVNVLEEIRTPPTAPSAKHTHFTGEEDEDVEMELKGVKLYVKRGAKPYGEGIPGHLKLLSHRTSLEERILFRREPLWKVSMNVRVQPTVRCAFVPEENALKFILKENLELPLADSPDLKQELVIYVLKPGRSCSKQDFKDFAVALSENAHFGSSTETSSKSS